MPIDRAADLHREVHDLDDLLAEHLAERAAEHGEVLGEDRDRAAVDGAVAGDHAVAVRAVVLQAEARRAVPGAARPSRRTSPRRAAARCRSRAVFLPLACCFSTARSEPGVRRLVDAALRSASLPAVVWMSMPESGRGRRCRRASGSATESVVCAMAGEPSLAPMREPLDSEALHEALVTSGRRGRAWTSTPRSAPPTPRRPGWPEPWRVVVADHQQAGRGRLGRTLGDAGAAPR